MAAHEGQTGPEELMVTSLAAGQLELSPERWAYLAPRLSALLADFSQLGALVPAGSEPAMTAELSAEVRRDRD